MRLKDAYLGGLKEKQQGDPPRGHFGSRAISVQVNIVAVSAHVFHKFPFDLLIQVSAAQLSLFLCILVVLMATDRTCGDAVHTTLPVSRAPLSSTVGSPYGSAPDYERTVSRSITMDAKSTKSTHSCRSSCKTRPELKIASTHFLKQWPPRRLRLQVLNILLGASWLALPLWNRCSLWLERPRLGKILEHAWTS